MKISFSFRIWQRKLLHRCFDVTSETESCNDFRCQILKGKWSFPDPYPHNVLRTSIKSHFWRFCQLVAIYTHKMTPITTWRLHKRPWDNLVREAGSSGPLYLAPVSATTSKNAMKRAFLELLADTGAKKRGPELAASPTKSSKFLAWHLLFFFFITLKPRVEWYTKSMSLQYEPASEPLHISVK